jgi:Flp pilus assembly protein protease CpaA
MKEKPRVPWFYWPWWMLVLAAALFVFYVLFTPVWMGIRLISWLAERRNMRA